MNYIHLKRWHSPPRWRLFAASAALPRGPSVSLRPEKATPPMQPWATPRVIRPNIHHHSRAQRGEPHQASISVASTKTQAHPIENRDPGSPSKIAKIKIPPTTSPMVAVR